MSPDFPVPEDDSRNGRTVTAEIRCVIPPDSERLRALAEFFKNKYAADSVEFVIKKDPSAADGFNIFIEGDNYDWTTLGRIRQLRRSVQALPKETDPGKIISLLRENIASFELNDGSQEVGRVESVGDGIAVLSGLPDLLYGEIVLFECGIKGMTMDIRTDGRTGIVLFGSDSEILPGSRVFRTRRTAGIPVNNHILGRMIDPLGKPVDGKGETGAQVYYPIEAPAPGIIDRKPVTRPLETGVMAIDALFPIGKGQRELIVGDRQTGKTSIAIDTVINQRGKNVVCVYVAISQKASSVTRVMNLLKSAGALDYTVIVSSPASDAPALQYIAPYTGCAVAEYFMKRGRDTLVIYDDLSKHAVAYRTISLLLGRAPGREAYPGDVFYLHSRLLERAAQLSDRLGGGSMTALPIVETQVGEVSAYIPTNVISITDGQIYLDAELFRSGQRPAVNVGLSVSRVGGSAQTGVMRKASGSARIDLAQYREMQIFSQFGSDLDEVTKKRLEYGAALTAVFRQRRGEPLLEWQQAVLLVTAREGFFNRFGAGGILKVKDDYLGWFEKMNSTLTLMIERAKTLDTDLKARITEAANRFFSEYGREPGNSKA
jgi:proton translocating ATP synthase, F1 alpha subunit